MSIRWFELISRWAIFVLAFFICMRDWGFTRGVIAFAGWALIAAIICLLRNKLRDARRSNKEE